VERIILNYYFIKTPPLPIPYISRFQFLARLFGGMVLFIQAGRVPLILWQIGALWLAYASEEESSFWLQ